MVTSKISELMKNNNILYSVIANIDNGQVETLGNKDKLKYVDLINTLFGDEDSIKALNASLEGQLMPRTWGQGEVSCIVCKPTSNTLVGLCYHENREPIESYRFSKDINKQIELIWNEYTV
jgi:hypothetical protein